MRGTAAVMPCRAVRYSSQCSASRRMPKMRPIPIKTNPTVSSRHLERAQPEHDGTLKETVSSFVEHAKEFDDRRNRCANGSPQADRGQPPRPFLRSQPPLESEDNHVGDDQAQT